MPYYALETKDRHGYGHDSHVFKVGADTQAEAEQEAIYQHGKLTGLDSNDISVELVAVL